MILLGWEEAPTPHIKKKSLWFVQGKRGEYPTLPTDFFPLPSKLRLPVWPPDRWLATQTRATIQFLHNWVVGCQGRRVIWVLAICTLFWPVYMYVLVLTWFATLPPEVSHIATHTLSIAQRGWVPYIYQFGFSTKSVSPVFSTSEKYPCYTRKKCASVISNVFKTSNPSIRAMWWKLYLTISQNDTFWCWQLYILIISKPVDRFWSFLHQFKEQ